MAAETYHFSRSARSPRALGLLAAWWAVVLILYYVLNAAPLITLLLAAASIPALIDVGANASSTLTISDSEITWQSGRRKGSLPRGQLASVRLDTRLDLSLRMTLKTHQGQKVRLPYECVPRANDIEAALNAQDIPFERHHFTLLS